MLCLSRARTVLVAGALAALATGCGTLPTFGRLQAPADARRVELARVPFFAQEAYQCGPAALAMALGAAGKRVTPEELVAEVYLPGREGSLQVEMLAATRRQGL